MRSAADTKQAVLERNLALADAAQTFADGMYADSSAAAALVRVFAVAPFGWLPPPERAFVNAFLEARGDAAAPSDTTPVLALLGSRGIESNWNDRTKSTSHRAIPLLSEAFVAGAPMIARLLRETGFSLRNAAKPNPQFVGHVGGDNVFFVGDASNTTDERGRRIIPEIAFVERYGIRTVFGSGCGYPSGRLFLTGIVFSRRVVSRDEAARFAPLLRNLVDSTTALATCESLYP